MILVSKRPVYITSQEYYKKGKHDDMEIAPLWTIDSKSELGLEAIQYPAELNGQGKIVVMQPSLSQRITIFQVLDS